MNHRVMTLGVLSAAILASAAVADPPRPTTTGPYFGKPPWLKRLIPEKRIEAPKPVKPRDPAAEAQAERAAAELNLHRRIAVCDKFREIALATNDEALMRNVEKLERDAFDLYQQATAHLPASRITPDEERLERQIRSTGPSESMVERLSPTEPVSRISTASNMRGGR